MISQFLHCYFDAKLYTELNIASKNCNARAQKFMLKILILHLKKLWKKKGLQKYARYKIQGL